MDLPYIPHWRPIYWARSHTLGMWQQWIMWHLLDKWTQVSQDSLTGLISRIQLFNVGHFNHLCDVLPGNLIVYLYFARSNFLLPGIIFYLIINVYCWCLLTLNILFFRCHVSDHCDSLDVYSEFSPTDWVFICECVLKRDHELAPLLTRNCLVFHIPLVCTVWRPRLHNF